MEENSLETSAEFPRTVFDIRYLREPGGFVNLGIHLDIGNKNMQLFVGRWHISIGWITDQVHPHPSWTSLIAYQT